MLHLKAYLTVLFVTLLAAATPTKVKAPASGIHIPLQKRTSLTNSDGTFNGDLAILQSIVTKNKYRQNLINLERNVGRQAFNKGAEIKTVATVPKKLQRRWSEPLTDEQNGSLWAGTISIGSPAKDFLINFDTGSADLWVPSVDCLSSGCIAKNKYNGFTSSTGTTKKGTFNITYTDGSNVVGSVNTETVTVAGVKVVDQTFAAATSVSPSFANDPADGMLGLAFQTISNLNATPFFNTAIDQGAVAEDLFSIKLAKTGSSLLLGGIDTTLYRGEIESHFVTGNGFWQISNASAIVNDTTAVSNFDTVIDSGTSILVGPPSAVKAFYSYVPGATLFDPQHGFYSFPCYTTPKVSFSWGDKNWEIDPSLFNLGETLPGSYQCVGALAGQDLSIGNNTWILGDTFLQNVYSIYSFNENAVGFALLA